MDFVSQLQMHMLPSQYRELSGKQGKKGNQSKLHLLR